MQTISHSGAWCVSTFINDYNWYYVLMFFKVKIEVLHNFKNYKAMFETQTNH
jgi:hypothetical protein